MGMVVDTPNAACWSIVQEGQQQISMLCGEPVLLLYLRAK